MSAHPRDRLIGELIDLVARNKAALAEAGRPDLAEHAHVCLDDKGNIWLSYSPRIRGVNSDVVSKALNIDPVYMEEVR